MRRHLPVSGMHQTVLMLWTPVTDSSCLLPQATSERFLWRLLSGLDIAGFFHIWQEIEGFDTGRVA